MHHKKEFLLCTIKIRNINCKVYFIYCLIYQKHEIRRNANDLMHNFIKSG